MAVRTTGDSSQRSGSDKREGVRHPRRVMVRYGTRSTDKTGFTRNISERGLFLQTNSVMAPGSTIQVKVQFPDHEFHMWAKVRWAKKAPGGLAGVVAAGMGVKLVDPPAEWIDYYRTHVVRR